MVVWICSTKGAFSKLFISFRRANYILWPSISRKWAKMKWLSTLEWVLIKFISKIFSKLLYERSWSLLIVHSVHSLLAAKQGCENKIFKQLSVSTNRIHQYVFFKVLVLNQSTKRTMTNSLSHSTLFIVLYQQMVNKNEMV